MKKIISLISVCVILVVFIILGIFIFNSKPVVNYDEPTEDIYNKIHSAVKKDGALVYAEINSAFGTNITPWEVSEVTYLDVIANFDGNYLIHYACDDRFMDTFHFVKLGKYCVRFDAEGFGIYSLKNDKLISCKQAYNEGLITNKVLGELYSLQKKEESKENQDSLPSIRMYKYKRGDINLNGKIDKSDLSSLKMAIEQDENFYPFAREVGDMNGDGVADSKDIEIMSKKVKKNK